jgi:hypothetical protein
MAGLVINGKEESVLGLDIINYKDDSKLKLKPGEDMRARNTRWIRSIVWHNTKNIQTVVKPGKGPNTDLDHRIARLWATDGRNAGAHLSVDWDGTICCHADLLLDATYHASSMNEVSIGGEIYEDNNGTVHEYQLECVVKLTHWLCQRFGIQKQIPNPLLNREIPRIVDGGRNCVGVFGHCHQYGGKKDDPGLDIFKLLNADGFKSFQFVLDMGSTYTPPSDIAYWYEIQKKLRVTQDGIPGPATRDALQAKGFAYGLYDWKTEL